MNIDLPRPSGIQDLQILTLWTSLLVCKYVTKYTYIHYSKEIVMRGTSRHSSTKEGFSESTRLGRSYAVGLS